MVNKTNPETIADIERMAHANWSSRLIGKATGVSKGTVAKYVRVVPNHDPVSNKAKRKYNIKKKVHFLFCGYCEKCFIDKEGEKTSDLKRGRIKRAFCTHRCAMNFRSAARAKDKCKRCKKTRRELAHPCFEGHASTGVCFIKGYCPHCYALRLQYKKNETLVKTHELTQQLKGELSNVKRKKHSRPSQSATGSNRRSTQRKSRSSAGASDFGSFFSHIAISPVGF